MLTYMEYLKIPANIVMVFVIVFLGIQIIGEILEFKGKVVPEFVKIRKYFARKKKERNAIRSVPETLQNVQKLLSEVEQHYSTDNITKRDGWITDVNNKLSAIDVWKEDFGKKLDKIGEGTTSNLIDSKRNAIIDFASRVSNSNSLATREQFNRMFKLYDEYEALIEENGLKNGEVNISYKIITKAYEDRVKNHTFAEDILGYE